MMKAVKLHVAGVALIACAIIAWRIIASKPSRYSATLRDVMDDIRRGNAPSLDTAEGKTIFNGYHLSETQRNAVFGILQRNVERYPFVRGPETEDGRGAYSVCRIWLRGQQGEFPFKIAINRALDHPGVDLYELLADSWQMDAQARYGTLAPPTTIFQAKIDGLNRDQPELEKCGITRSLIRGVKSSPSTLCGSAGLNLRRGMQTHR